MKKPTELTIPKTSALLIGAYTESVEESNVAMAELKALAESAGLVVADCIIQRRRQLDPKTLIGKGKIEEIVELSQKLEVNLLIFDKELKPSQLRAITSLTDLKVIDRSMLILDIFAQRAKTSEGRLQVELAQLKYSLPRLTDLDSGLSRLTGGIGGRGPGETKLEISRRRARERIAILQEQINEISKRRGVKRNKRESQQIPVIAIVGYTNAGKSTLLNALTKSSTWTEDKLFATLDTTSRRMYLASGLEVIFVDTVGFIRDLPKELVTAFKATLEEIETADVLLHLADITDPDLSRRIKVVADTLESLNVYTKPQILVLNKIDAFESEQVKILAEQFHALTISAKQRIGLQELIQNLRNCV
ncbi:MAG: GTPase HflX [Deltaproteobacteria bacterium]|jgi:GTP-binding protein HflX|nr:GTPase HflX [Deltaproteobacteria bacterium]